MTMPQLTPAHRALERLIGHWQGEERIHPSPWAPQGALAQGTVFNRSSLDGFAVVQDYAQTRDGQVNYRGHGVFRWDQERSEYVLHWFDSSGQAPAEFRGPFLDGVLTLGATSLQGHTRAIFDFRAADRYLYRMDVSPDGAQWHPFLEGTYLRQAAAR